MELAFVRSAGTLCIVTVGCMLAAGLVHGGPPQAPSGNVPPAGGIVGANPLLCVNVSDPDGDPLTVEFRGRNPAAPPGEEFTIVVLPDTQHYSLYFPFVFESQTQWIVDNKDARNIRFVSQVGDCVNNAASEIEWTVADAAMSRIEDPVTTGLPDGMPYGIALGNHDNNGFAGTLANQSQASELYNATFGVERFDGRVYYGGHFGTNNDNHYELFSASGMDFIALHLEWEAATSPLREAVLAWADDVLAAHPERRAIVTVHYLLTTTGEWGNQGQATYDALKDNPNLFLMLCGHLWNNPRRLDTYNGSPVHTVMSNYQHLPPLGGNGWLRIMTFKPQLNQIQVQTYSPWLDSYLTDTTEQFTLPYDMGSGVPFQLLGTVSDVPSGSAACIPWPGRQSGAAYQWRVKVSDATATTTGPVWSFTSTGACTTLGDCADGDTCTSDACQSNVCQSVPIPGCCEADADCTDGDLCTDDLCVGNLCQTPLNAGPCTDGVGCTVADTCGGGVCAGTPLECDDANACTAEACDTGGCVSVYAPAPGCCAAAADCDDLDPCTTDACAGGNCTHAAIPGCCVTDAECAGGSACAIGVCETNLAALSLAGGAHMSVGELGTTLLNQELNAAAFTIETWFKWDGGGIPGVTASIYEGATGGGIKAYPLITKGRDMPDNVAGWHINYYLGIRDTDHVLVADFEQHASGPSPGKNHPVVGTTPVTPGVWHHAAATYDGCCWQLYLDGWPDTGGTNCPGQTPNWECGQHFALGTGQTVSGDAEGAFYGLLDEARVWSRARSAEEIQAARFAQVATDPDLLGRWGFEDAAGYVASDSTGLGNDGKLVWAEWELSDLPPLPGSSCSYPAIPGCCQAGPDCNDGNACTADSCAGGSCANAFAPFPGCCVTAAHCDDGNACTTDSCASGSCANVVADSDGDLLPDCQETDDDADGAADCQDCAPADPGAAAPPAPIGGLRLGKNPVTLLTWDDPGAGLLFDAASGSGIPWGPGDAACLLDDGAQPQHADTRPDPPPGGLYYYLVRADGVCAGPWGATSAGLPNLVASPCL